MSGQDQARDPAATKRHLPERIGRAGEAAVEDAGMGVTPSDAPLASLLTRS